MTIFPDDTIKSALKALLKDAGFKPSSRLGQNFLIDKNLLLWIVREAELSRDDLVLEIGAGPGILTRFMAPEAGKVVAVELQKNLFEIARRWLAEFSNVILLNCDALDGHHLLNREIEETIEREAKGMNLKVVSNLPYSIATTVIAALLTGDLPVTRMLLTVQKEVAERLTARVGTKPYGSISVLVQATAHVRILRKIPPDVFWPKPKVYSSVIEILPDSTRKAEIDDLKFLERVTKGLFSRRRKTAQNAMRSLMRSVGLEERLADKLMVRCGIDPSARCETITPEQFVTLSNILRGKIGIPDGKSKGEK